MNETAQANHTEKKAFLVKSSLKVKTFIKSKLFTDGPVEFSF